MSLINTKPTYFPSAIATESGWINPITKELLVSVGGLKSKLAIEAARLVKEVEVIQVPIEVLPQKKVIMTETSSEVKNKSKSPRKHKVIGEVNEKQIPVGQQLIGEVVEYNLDTQVIAE